MTWWDLGLSVAVAWTTSFALALYDWPNVNERRYWPWCLAKRFSLWLARLTMKDHHDPK